MNNEKQSKTNYIPFDAHFPIFGVAKKVVTSAEIGFLQERGPRKGKSISATVFLFRKILLVWRPVFTMRLLIRIISMNGNRDDTHLFTTVTKKNIKLSGIPFISIALLIRNGRL
jgi:hypothetical protein